MSPESPEGSGPDGHDARGAERRQWTRRALPFGRGAVLEIGERSHVVGLGDLSEGGALLLTRASAAVGESAVLKLSMISHRAEVKLRCTVIRVVAGPSGDSQRGLGVRFDDPDDQVRGSIAAFVARDPNGRTS
ncbi:MAG: PilZ domain-containing protein [Acidobacteria bacterium]|jgi:Tfp pilus assembly protein PilZ|nr:PilZ domain-containing protein [Acidobacteriota bacterium]